MSQEFMGVVGFFLRPVPRDRDRFGSLTKTIHNKRWYSMIFYDILWYSMIFDMLPYFPKNSYDTPWFTFIADSLSWTLSVFSSLTLILWVFITISWSFGTFSGHNWPGALITGPFNGWETLQQTSHCDDMNTPTQKTLVLEAKSP